MHADLFCRSGREASRIFLVLVAVCYGSFAAFGQLDVIQLSGASYSVLENSGHIAIQLQRAGPMTDYATVQVRTEFSKLSSNADTNDFQSFSATVEFAPGESNRTVTIEIFNDRFVEGNEWFEVILSEPDPFCCQLGPTTWATVLIQDNDLGVQFDSPRYTVSEDAGELRIHVSRLGDMANEPGSVAFQIEDWGATSEVDFIPDTNKVTFSAGQTTATIRISIINDWLLEGWEYFNVRLEEDPDSSCCALGVSQSSEVWIDDNDHGVEFARATYAAREGERPGEPTPVEIQVRRVGDPTNEFTVDLEIEVSSPVIVGRDFIVPTNRLFFPSGQSNVVAFTLSILDDPVVEAAWLVRLHLRNPAGGVSLGRTSACEIRIYDNEYPARTRDPGFWLSSTQLFLFEDDPHRELTVFRGGDSSSGLSVDFTTAGEGVAELNFVPSPGTLTFQPLETTKTITFRAVDDCRVEPDQIVEIALANPSAGAVISEPGRAKLFVADDDTAGSLDRFAPSLDWAPFRLECPFFCGASNSTIALQPDGQILVERYGLLTRVNHDGSQDPTYLQGHPSTCADYPGNCPQVCHIPSVAVQADGKIFVAGLPSIFRLHSNGTRDTNFFVSVRKVIWGGIGHWIAYPANVTSLILQPDRKILAVGDFNQVSGRPCSGVTRLNPDSTVDVDFTVNARALDWFPRTAALLADGKLLAGGSSLARLNPDGTRDTNFAFRADETIQAIAILPDQKILIGRASFSCRESFSGKALDRLQPDGSLDTSFNPAIIVESSVLTSASAITVAKEGNIFVAGQFSDGTTRIVKLDSEGSLISNFNSGLRFSGGINSIIEQPDNGEVLVAGNFTSVNGIPRPGIARLKSERSHLRLSPPALQPDGSMRIVTAAHAGATYILQKSADLNEWISVSTNVAVDCTVELTDASPSPWAGFYRVIKTD